MTGRWLAGCLQLLLFLAGAVTACGAALAQIAAVYRSALALTQDPNAELVTPSAASLYVILPGLMLALAVELWSICDAGKKPRLERGP